MQNNCLIFDPTLAKYFVRDPTQQPIKEECQNITSSDEDDCNNHNLPVKKQPSTFVYPQQNMRMMELNQNFNDLSLNSEVMYTTPKAKAVCTINSTQQTPSPLGKQLTYPRKKLQNNNRLMNTDSSFIDSLNQTQQSSNSSVSKQEQFNNNLQANLFGQFEEQQHNFYPQIFKQSDKPLTSFQQFHKHKKVARKVKAPECQRDGGYNDVIVGEIMNDNRTTLMIKNIPNKYTQEGLLKMLNQKNEGEFDFFYLPIDFTNKCNVGYAFINFVKGQYIQKFYNYFHDKPWETSNSQKICQIKYATIQGKSNLEKHFEDSKIMNQNDRKLKPLFFCQIQQLDFSQIQQLVQRQKDGVARLDFGQ